MANHFGIVAFLILHALTMIQTTSADLVAKWDFEPGALTHDGSGNGYTLSASSVSLSTSEVAPGTGSTASAYFNGNAFLKTLGTLDLNAFPGKNLRISFWMKNLLPINTSPTSSIYVYGNSWNQCRGSLMGAANGMGYTGVSDRPGCVGIQLADDRKYEHVNYETLDNGVGEWEHFQIEYRPDAPAADVIRVYKDGEMIPDANPAPWNRHYSRYVDAGGVSGENQATTLANETLYIGARAGNRFQFFGLLDEVRLVDNTTDAIIAEWRFEPDAFFADSSGNGYHLVEPAGSYGGDFQEFAPDGSGCAFFDGTRYLKTVIPLDLSAYDNVSLNYRMFNYAPAGSGAGVLFEQGENADDQQGFYVVVNEAGDTQTRFGQVGVKTPGVVRDGLPHSSLDWREWETPVWEEYTIDFDLTAATFEDRVRIGHDGVLLEDIVFSASDLDAEGNKRMRASSDVGVEPWSWPRLPMYIGTNGSTGYFTGYLDNFMIEVFSDSAGAVPEPGGFTLLAMAAVSLLLRRRGFLVGIAVAGFLVAAGPAGAAPLQVGTFQADITPPLGSPLCFGGVADADSIVDRLSARGVVLVADDGPIVLCSLDWIGVGNGGYQEFRRMLADAAGTTPDRVALQCIHQHDAPGVDFDTELLLAEAGLSGAGFNPNAARISMMKTARAVAEAMENLTEVTHIGIGSGIVEKVASNRRILGPDGEVERMRFTSCTDPIAIAAPEGTIDPECKLISFWNGYDPIASMTHYATHPQSHYGRGDVSYDFPGMARARMESILPDVFHVHFTGAGGNIGAGKYNDGSPENRPILAGRLFDGMEAAWNNQTRIPLSAETVEWSHVPLVLPVRPDLTEETLLAKLHNQGLPKTDRIRAARDLAFARRMNAGEGINVNYLALGDAAGILYMPGELFVEYQLAAQAMRPDKLVAMSAYSDYGPGYICTEIAYWEGGYEAGRASLTTKDAEAILMKAMEDLLFDRLVEGDADADGFVGSGDLDVVRANWGSTVGYGNFAKGDFSGDGLVGSADLDVVRANWGTGTPASVPEPGTWMLLGGLAVWGLRRRRAVGRLGGGP